MELIRGIVDPKIELKLVETKDTKSLVDGENIIGVMEGNFFVPGGISRNKRFYSKGLWKKTLSNENVQKKLIDRSMYGTIGHDTLVNDESLAKGLLTHITDKLYIDEKGQGIGRALILNTTAGKNLKTVLGAGGKVYVSSRAMGTFEGKTSQGVPKVKEGDYDLKGFDAVLDPGFLEANPTLRESLEYSDSFKGMINECYDILEDKTDEPDSVINEVKEEENIEEKFEMEKGMLETIQNMTTENAKVRSALDESLKSQEAIKAENDVLQSENENLKKQLKEQEDDIEKKKKDDEEEEEKMKEAAEEKAKDAKKTMNIIKQFIDPELKKAKGEKGEAVDPTDEEVVKAFEEFIEDVGTAKQIGTAFETLEAKLDEFKEFEEDYGTAEDIDKLLTAYESLGERQITASVASKAEKIAAEVGVSKEKVEALLVMNKDLDEEAVKEFFKDMKESLKVKHTYSRKKIDEKKDKEGKKPFDKTLGESILQGMNFKRESSEGPAFNEEQSLGESILKTLV